MEEETCTADNESRQSHSELNTRIESKIELRKSLSKLGCLSDGAKQMAQNQGTPREMKKEEWRQAIKVWLLFFAILVTINGTVPFILGYDMHAWISSPTKLLLGNFAIYGGLFLVLPLLLIKGPNVVVRTPSFLIPLAIAVVGVGVWNYVPYSASLAIVAVIYLHRRFNLSGYGFKSKGWKGDIVAILLYGSVQILTVFFKPGPVSVSLANGVAAGVFRLFANPASTVETFFYFGFVTERLSQKTGKILTPPLIGAMYTAHEMSNPEYWYGGTLFLVIFVGVTIATAIYLWRRNVAPMWLGDGLGKLLSGIF